MLRPYTGPEMNPPIKTSSLNEIFVQHQALIGERAGWRVARRFAAQDDELRAAREGVALSDETPNGKVMVEGADVNALLQKAFGISPPDIQRGAEFERGFVYRLRRDLYWITTDAGSENAFVERATAMARDLLLLPVTRPDPGVIGARHSPPEAEVDRAFVTITDLTHGYSEFRVIGPASRALLSKVCGLDVHPRAFPNHGAQQSSLAKTVQLIVRRDVGSLPAFSIIGARSLGAYVWQTLLNAGHEFGIAPIGYETVEELEKE